MVCRACLGLMGLLAFGSAACSEESATEIDVGPTGEPSIAFVAPSSADPQPLCVVVGDEPDARIAMLVETAELVLRPPGACGYYQQCGHLDLFVDDVLNNESAVPALELLLRKLADRYHDGSPRADDGQPDVLHVRVVAVTDDERPMGNHEGQAIEDLLELTTVPSCE
jgi:hypothetical protein